MINSIVILWILITNIIIAITLPALLDTTVTGDENAAAIWSSDFTIVAPTNTSVF